MTPIAEVLTCACRKEDISVLQQAFESAGTLLQEMESTAELARQAVTHSSMGIVLGVGKNTLHHLDVIPVIRAVREELPVIVIAEEDSLELERAVREKGVFYYLVHPIDRQEVCAVLEDVLRHTRG